MRDGRTRGDKQRPSRDAKHDPKSGNSIVDRFPKVFSGVGKLSGCQLKLLIDPKVRPVAQKPKITRKKYMLLDLNIIEKVSGPITWVSIDVFAKRLKNMTETLLQDRDITLNNDKCKIGMSQNVFMGLILNKYGVEPTEEKVKAIRETKSPTNVECRTHQCRTTKLSGRCQFQRTVPVRFRDNCGTTQEVDSPGYRVAVGKEENEAFEALKNQLAEASMTAFNGKEAPTEVVTAVSPVGRGATLVQEKQGVNRAVVFASRSLSDVERRYSQTEKEVLAAVWACEKLHLYLTGLDTHFNLSPHLKLWKLSMVLGSKPLARVEHPNCVYICKENNTYPVSMLMDH